MNKLCIWIWIYIGVFSNVEVVQAHSVMTMWKASTIGYQKDPRSFVWESKSMAKR